MNCPICERPMDRTGRRSRAATCGRPECMAAHKRKKRAATMRGYRQRKREAGAA